MKSLGEIEATGSHFDKLSDWEQDPCSLWTAPSSPPYNDQNSRNDPFLSTNQRSIGDQSSPSTPSEFEFDLLATPGVRDEPPVSPKFLSSPATGYWAAMASSQERDNACTQICDDTVTPVDRLRRGDAPTTMTETPHSHSRKQRSTPPSHSVRQLITEEMCGGECDESDLDFYSAPQTPTTPHSRPLTPKHRPVRVDYEPSAVQQTSNSVAPMMAQRKSKSASSDRPNIALYPELATKAINGLTTSKSQPHARSIDSTLFAWDQSEEERKNTAAKKSGSSKSFRKWAFKDLLRRTVPSSKADAHYITKTMEAPNSSRSLLSNPRSAPISPQASPLRSYIESRSPTLQGARPSSHVPRSPPHRSPLAHAGSRSPAHLWDTHSETSKPRHSSVSSRTPAPSPPRSPLSPHVAHYKLQKAQSQEAEEPSYPTARHFWGAWVVQVPSPPIN